MIGLFDGKKIGQKHLERFIADLMLMTPAEIIGVAHMIKVPVWTDDKQPVEGEQLIVNMCDTFLEKNRIQRRNMLKLMDLTVKGRKNQYAATASEEVKDNGSSTENS